MNKKILYGFLPLFLSFVVLFIPLKALAAPVDEEDYVIYSGVLQFVGNDDYLYLHSSADVSSAWDNSKVVTFSGKQLEYMSFEQVEGYTYNGQANFQVEYKIENMPSGVYVSYPTFYLTDVNTPDNVTVTAQMISRDAYSITINYIVSFSNYIATYSGIGRFSYLANFDYYVFLTDTQLGNTIGSSDLRLGRYPEVDWHGYLYEYVQLEDAPGYEGTTINQNQTIINQSQTQNNLTSEQNTIIQDQTSQQHQDSQAQINQSIQNTDQITNGFDNSAGSAAADRLEDSTSSLENAEDSLFGQVSDADEDYTDLTNFFSYSSVIESFSFVKSAMESIFINIGDFSVPITIGFMFIILTRILGYQQFTSGGG